MNQTELYHYNRLYPFQKEGVQFLVNNRTALLADDVGVGKTAQALVAATAIQARKILVICTASIKYDWKRRAVEWGYSSAGIHVVDTKTINKMPVHDDVGMFIVNYDLIFRREFAKVLATTSYDLLICDESHSLKNHTTKRTKAVFGAGGYAARSARTWLLTGTPVLNRPEEIYTTLKALCPELLGPYTDYIMFTRRYCGGHKGTWGWVANGATNQAELAGMINRFMLRRERDILTDLPDKIMRVMHLERTKEIERILFEEPEDESQAVASVRQRMGLAKVPAVIDYVKDRLESEKKVIVFAYHTEVIRRLREGLKEFHPEYIDGGVSAATRSESQRLFREQGKCRVIILQIDAAGTGIDGLQAVCRHAIFAEISYVPGVNQQAMGRLHRNGQKEKTVFDFLVVEDSLDENVLTKNVIKSGVVQRLMGDENRMFDFTIQKEKVMPNEEPYNDRIEVEMVIEVADRQHAEHLGRIMHSQEGVRVLSSRVSFPLWPKVKSVVEEIDAQQAALGGLPAEEPAGVTGARVKAARKKKGEVIPAIAPVSTTPNLMQPAVLMQTGPNGYGAPAVHDPFAQVPLPPAAPTFQGPITKEQYHQEIFEAIGKIQSHVGAQNPNGINAAIQELNGKLKAKFPQYDTVMNIDNMQEQLAVLGHIKDYLNQKGIVRG